MKFLIILGNYLPKMHANGICTNEIIKELIKRGHEINVLCYSNSDNNRKNELINGVEVHRVRAPKLNRYRNSIAIERKELKWKIGYYYNKLITRLLTLFHLPFYPLNSIKMVCRYYTKAKELYDQEKFDVVIGVYKPLEAIIASTLISKKYKEVKSGIYILDTLIDQQGKSLLKWWFDKSGWLWEKKLYNHNDFVINMISFKEKYNNSRYEKFRGKLYFSDIPLYTNEELQYVEFNQNYRKKKWLYAGTLNRKTRNPEYLCKLFLENNLIEKNEIHFYSNGNCEDVINDYSKKVPMGIFQHGFVNRDQILKEIKEADVLVSIGNKHSTMVPSKIFEYISTGKKIIHFYLDDNDSCLKYLRKYKNALLIDEKESINFNLNIIINFIYHTERIIDLEYIDNEFKLNKPSYTVDIIESSIKL
jgi:hypothetical protein